ncbi:MAG: hypothetical protein R3B99_14355 [Polyangiales bacterium]
MLRTAGEACERPASRASKAARARSSRRERFAKSACGILLGHREVIPARTAEGQWVVRPDEAAIARALEGLFDAPPAPGTPHPRTVPSGRRRVASTRASSDE